MEFVWEIYVVQTTVQILERTKTVMEEKGTKPAQFQDRIIFMFMYSDFECWKKNNQNEFCNNAKRVAQCAENFKPGHWSFVEPGVETNVVWKHDKPNRRKDGNRLVSVNQFSIYRAVLIWYVEKRSE